MRILEGVADPSLRAEMNHPLEVVGGEQLRHRRSVRKVRLQEPKSRVILEPLEPRSFQSDAVVIVQIVEPDNLMAVPYQAHRGCGADKTGRTSDEYLHGSTDYSGFAGCAVAREVRRI
jgi:hypothetical protein